MLDFHVGRIEESLRLLYPDLDLDRAAEIQLAEEEDGAKSPLDVHDTHPRTSRDSPPGGAVRIFWAGEPDSAGIVAAQDLSMLLAQELGGARGEVRMMRGATADDVAHGGLRQGAHASVFVLECDGDGAPVFPAARLLRALNAADAGAAPLTGLSFAVLGVARSACSFSAASLGPAKFQAPLLPGPVRAPRRVTADQGAPLAPGGTQAGRAAQCPWSHSTRPDGERGRRG